MKKLGLRVKLFCAVLSFVLTFTMGSGILNSYATPGSGLTVTYMANGGTGADIVLQDVSTGSTIMLQDNHFTPPSGQLFAGWSINGVKREVGDFYVVTTSTAILALWGDDVVVSYEANGGTGTGEQIHVATGSTITLKNNPFTAPSGQVFDGWLVGSTKMAEGDTYTVTTDTAILASWASASTAGVDVTYKANGGTGADVTTRVALGQNIVLKNNPFIAPSGQVFDGWEINGVKFPEGATYRVTGATEILALWRTASTTDVTVTYKPNGGIGNPITTSVTTQSPVNLPTNPFRAPSGYVFDGWEINGVKKAEGDSFIFTTDTDVLATWKRTDGSGSGGSGSGSDIREKKSKKEEMTSSPKKEETRPVFQGDNASSQGTSGGAVNKAVQTSVTLKIGSTTYKVVENGKTVTKKMDVAPMIYKGRTMIPTRMMAELLGVGVSYNAKTKTAVLVYNKNKIELTLGKQTMKVNGKEQKLSAPMMMKNNRVLLPLTDIQRAFKELGLRSEVTWDPATKSIGISK